jgi:hypothetical protein
MPKKTPPKQTAAAPQAAKPRQLKPRQYQSFKLQKTIKPVTPQLPSAFRLLVGSLQMLKQHWRPFLGIMLIFGLLNLLFVKGFGAGADLTSIKDSLTGTGGTLNDIVASSTLFVYLIGTSGNATSETAGIAQVILGIVGSLAVIWTLRQVYAGKKVNVRDGFYSGMYPLIPYILVCIVIILQLTPLAVSAFFLSAIAAAGGEGLELAVWGALVFFSGILSLYLVTSSIFALYIVCLPDMRPMVALRSARELVRYRRWAILRKLLFLPLILMVAAALITIPVIVVAPVVASWFFFVFTMLGIMVTHSYAYRLYRELL